jgi:hypothetical protein
MNIQTPRGAAPAAPDSALFNHISYKTELALGQKIYDN